MEKIGRVKSEIYGALLLVCEEAKANNMTRQEQLVWVVECKMEKNWRDGKNWLKNRDMYYMFYIIWGLV